MAFTDIETAEQLKVIEDVFWSRRRPPLNLRGQVREGQRFTQQSIDLFIVRPAYQRPRESFEQPIARVRFVRSRNVWRLFWPRADGKWHGYRPCPEVSSLRDALCVIDGDAHHCFFG